MYLVLHFLSLHHGWEGVDEGYDGGHGRSAGNRHGGVGGMTKTAEILGGAEVW